MKFMVGCLVLLRQNVQTTAMIWNITGLSMAGRSHSKMHISLCSKVMYNCEICLILYAWNSRPLNCHVILALNCIVDWISKITVQWEKTLAESELQENWQRKLWWLITLIIFNTADKLFGGLLIIIICQIHQSFVLCSITIIFVAL